LKSIAISFLIKSEKSGLKHNAANTKIIIMVWLHTFFINCLRKHLGGFFMLYLYTMQKNPKNPKIYNCKKCNFISSNKKDYNKHLTTAKHINTTNTTQKPTIQPVDIPHHICSCGRTYKYRASLYNHKKKCNVHIIPTENDFPTINEPTSDASTILLLLKQNQEFKSLMVEQYTHLQESNQKNQELQQQLVDAVKNNTGSITNNNNNTTNNNNNQFNLNFFLNDTCKDAMNITDFLSNLDVHIDELEYIGNHGYVNGMTKMIMERLKGMDITKRPIHCTDIKRETMYIKDKDEWSKDTDELTKVRKILNRISMNNYRTIPEWKNAHPECEVVASRTYDFCYSMMESLLGDVEDEQLKLDNKIIKTMAKTLYVNKINA
jgi:hypothetical protein